MAKTFEVAESRRSGENMNTSTTGVGTPDLAVSCEHGNIAPRLINFFDSLKHLTNPAFATEYTNREALTP